MRLKKIFSGKAGPEQSGDIASPTSANASQPANPKRHDEPKPFQGCGFLATLKTIVGHARSADNPGTQAGSHRISSWNVPNTLVTRWSNFPRESHAENVAYGKFMAASIEKTAAALASGKITSLDDLWAVARTERLASFLDSKNVRSAAELTDPEDREFFDMASELRGGQLLTTPIKTACDLRYEYITPTIQRTARSMFKFKVSDDLWSTGEVTLRRYNQSGEYQLKISGRAEVAGESCTKVLWNLDTREGTGTASDFSGPDAIERVKMHNRIEVDNVDFTSKHYDSKAFRDNTFYPVAERATQRALKATDPATILNHAFEAYWELAMAAPDVRGSAAKAHYVLQSILLSKGIELPPARQGMAPDLEAMARTRSDWVDFARVVFNLRS